jgi:PAS domain S-box-containing protein
LYFNSKDVFFSIKKVIRGQKLPRVLKKYVISFTIFYEAAKMDDRQNNITVLTVEDDLSTRKTISLYLGSKGFRVKEAKDGRMGLDLFRQENIGLVLLDLRIPEIDGLEVLETVTGESPETPVIIISGTGEISDVVQALRLGAWDYVLKPIHDMSVLMHSIEKVLERARLLQQNQRYQEQLEEDIERRTQELRQANVDLSKEIKERKRIEEALRENEKAYRAIFNAAAAAFFIIDSQGTIVEANSQACKQYGYQLEEFTKMSLKDIIPLEDHEKFELLLKETKTKGHSQYEIQGVRQDGSVRINEAVGTIVGYKGKEHILAVFRDITQQIEAQENERMHQQQLIQADKMASLGVLVSEVAHEINNPNNFIMVNTPILSKIWKTIEPILQNHYQDRGDFYIAPRVKYSEMKDNIPGIISGIREGAQRIDLFVKELKNFSRPTPSTQEKKIHINKVIQAAITLLANLIKKSTNRFYVDYGEGIPVIPGNFQRLEQVMINLIENSCQALQDKEQGIFISTGFDHTGKTVKIQLKDEGMGMTSETIEKITNPFFTTKRSSGGTGLGLSISWKIVEDHKGVLRFESEPGVGTRAVVLLPVESNPLTNQSI